MYAHPLLTSSWYAGNQVSSALEGTLSSAVNEETFWIEILNQFLFTICSLFNATFINSICVLLSDQMDSD